MIPPRHAAAPLLGLVFVSAALAFPEPDSAADPLPLRRVAVPAARVPAELEKAKQGVLVQLGRDEFESHVRAAARAAARSSNPPRLVRANYSARLEGAALVGGGDWAVLNPGDGPAVLTLPEFNLALRKLTYDDPNTPPVLGELDGKALGLLVPRAGRQSYFFDWSLRGAPSGAELLFDLQVPACPAASLELTLPADHGVSAPRGVALVTGPHESADAALRMWRVEFAGRSRLDLVVRRPEAPGRPAVLLSRVQTAQQVGPRHVLCRYEFTVEALHHPVRELTFECDAGLEPYDVFADKVELKNWDLDGEPGGRRVLTVRPRQPFLGASPPLKLTVLAQAELPQGAKAMWTSPGVRLRGASHRGEQLTIQTGPDVRLEGLKAGAFRVVQASAAPDGGQSLTLADGPGASGKGRPSAAVRGPGVEASARQLTWWQVGPGGSTLTAEINYEVTRGTLFRLLLSAPAGWQVEDVRADPPELLGNSSVAPAKGTQTITVDLQRGLTAGKSIRLTVRLKGSQGKAAPAVVAFPDVDPLDCRQREGALAVSVDPLYRAEVPQTTPPATAAPAGPWGNSLPDFYYLYKSKSVTGKLPLKPRRSSVQARVGVEAFFAGGRAALAVRLELAPLAGAPDAVDLWISAPASRWRWRAGAVAGFKRQPALEALPRLLGLGQGHPLTAAALSAGPPLGERWRLTLARPLARRETVTLEADLEPEALAGAGRQRWRVPLVTVAGAEPMEGEATLHLLGTELLDAAATAARDTGSEPPPGRPAGPDSWRKFRYGAPDFAGRLPELTVETRALAAGRAAREGCERARLTTYVEPHGRLLHQLTFEIDHWKRHALPVLLPAGSKLLAARVEGRVLDSVPQAETPNGLQVELPSPAGDGPHRFEVVYTSADDWPEWWPWSRLRAELPRLPVPPTSFRRTWRLAPGLAPLTGAARRLPGAGGDDGPWWSRAEAAWRGGRRLLAVVGPELASEDWLPAQKQLIAGAGDALKRLLPSDKQHTFGDAVERLALEHFRQVGTLVVDAAALREAGLRRRTPLPPSGVDGFDLVLVPAPACPLLTTRRQAEQWRGASEMPAGLARAVAEARASGHDASGRFVLAAQWLRGGAEPADDDAPEVPWLESFGAAWSEYEALPGAGESLVVVREEAVRTAGLALAGLLLVVAWGLRKSLSWAWRFRLLVLWLAAAGLALFWAPPGLTDAAWWPALAGCAVAVVWYARGALPREPGPVRAAPTTHKGPRAAVAGGAAVLLLALAHPGAGQPPAALEPYTVLILPDEGKSGSVLVAPELLRKLDDLTKKSDPPPRGAVLLSAKYTGEVVGDRAEMVAEYQVYCAAAEATVTLPLGGVDLREGTLWAGARAFPVAAGGGYAVPVRRSGAHPVNTLRVPFAVRLAPAEDGRELRFGIPKLPQSRLRLTLPASAESVTVTSMGARSPAKAKGAVEADLGREGAVLVRWRTPSAPRPSQVEVREAYFWDLRPGGTLTAVLNYAVSGGPVARFEVALPPGAAVRAVEASASAAGSVRLKSWQVIGVGNARRVRIELQAPVTGGVQVTLSLAPPLASGPMRLALPAPPGARSLDGVLAYRADGLESSEKLVELAATRLTAEGFARAWQGLGMASVPASTRAYAFKRKGGAAAVEVSLGPPRPAARQEVAWRVHAQHADFEAEVKLSSANELGLVEWDVPASAVVSRVTGPQVRQWTRHEGRVQVWLQPQTREATLRLHGWVSYPKGKAAGPPRFLLRPVRLVSASPSPNLVRVGGPPELAIEPDLSRPWQSLQVAGGEPLTYLATQPFYGADFLLKPAPVVPQAVCLTAVEAQSGALHFVGHVDYHIPHGELKTATVKLRNWDEAKVRVEAPGAEVRELPAKRGERTWLLTLPAGVVRQYAVRLSGSMPLKAGAKTAMPEVTASGAEVRRRYVAAVGLRGEAAVGLTPAKEAALRAWPGEAERLRRGGSAWEVQRDDWSLRLIAEKAAAPAVQVLLGEQEAAVADLKRWAHQATYWLYSGGAAEARLSLPSGARLLGATVDGDPAALRPADAGQVALLLPGGEGPHVLRLRWAFDAGEKLEAPNLEAPRLEGAGPGPSAWHIDVPAGYRVRTVEQAADAAQPVGAAVLDLTRAEAQLRLAELLAERMQSAPSETLRGQLVSALRDYLRYTRDAGRQILSASSGTRTAEEWAKRLETRAAKLTGVPGVASARQEAGGQASTAPAGREPFALPDRGQPLHWYAEGGGSAPALRLTPVAEARHEEAAFSSGVLLLALIAVCIVAISARLRRVAPLLLPEQVALLGWLGWQAFGPSLLGGLMMLGGVSLRLGLVAAWLQGVLRKPAPEPPGSSYTTV